MVESRPAREFKKPGLSGCVNIVKSEWTKIFDSQEDFIQSPEVILPPPPPEPGHTGGAECTAHPSHYIPMAAVSTDSSVETNLKTYKGNCVTALISDAETGPPLLALRFSKLVKVPGNRMKPASKIQLKNPADKLWMKGISSNARSMLTYWVSIWLCVPRRCGREGVEAVTAAEGAVGVAFCFSASLAGLEPPDTDGRC